MSGSGPGQWPETRTAPDAQQRRRTHRTNALVVQAAGTGLHGRSSGSSGFRLPFPPWLRVARDRAVVCERKTSSAWAEAGITAAGPPRIFTGFPITVPRGTTIERVRELSHSLSGVTTFMDPSKASFYPTRTALLVSGTRLSGGGHGQVVSTLSLPRGSRAHRLERVKTLSGRRARVRALEFSPRLYKQKSTWPNRCKHPVSPLGDNRFHILRDKL